MMQSPRGIVSILSNTSFHDMYSHCIRMQTDDRDRLTVYRQTADNKQHDNEN